MAVHRGVTHLDIFCLDSPVQLCQVNGETRIMLVDWKAFRLHDLPKSKVLAWF